MVEQSPFCYEIEGEGDTSGKCRKPPYANQTMQTTNNNHRATITTMTINTLFVNIVICGFRSFTHLCCKILSLLFTHLFCNLFELKSRILKLFRLKNVCTHVKVIALPATRLHIWVNIIIEVSKSAYHHPIPIQNIIIIRLP